MSSPKFLSPVNSQTEMPGYVSTISGDGEYEHEGRVVQTIMGLCVIGVEGSSLSLYCC